MMAVEMHRDEVAPVLLSIRFERAAIPGTVGWPGKRARFYEMRIERDAQLTLDGSPSGFVLYIERGAMGAKTPTTRTETFPTLPRAIERWGHFCAERRAHGYYEAPKA